MTKETNVKAQAKTAAESVKTGAENTGLAAPSLSDVQKARTEGVTEAIKEQAKESYIYATDGQQPGDPTDAFKWHGYDDIAQWAPLLALDIEGFAEAIAEDAGPPVPDVKVYGLLALERNGQNRTDYVKAAMARLGLKADELPGGGPAYTNPVVSLDKL